MLLFPDGVELNCLSVSRLWFNAARQPQETGSGRLWAVFAALQLPDDHSLSISKISKSLCLCLLLL